MGRIIAHPRQCGEMTCTMKKTFPFAVEGKHPDRLLDAIKHELRKYIQRERRRALPEGVDFWDFDCKFGPDAANAEVAHIAELNKRIDALRQAGGTQFYVEILAKHGMRKPRNPAAEASQE
jgi:predicted N-acyltransferase